VTEAIDTTPVSPPDSVRKLSLPVMGAFGIGQVAEGVKGVAFSTFLLFYYQQVLGVSGTLTGLALAIALVFDAVTDPIAGSVSDKIRTRWGRRHPFILISAVPLGLAFLGLFNPPDGLSEIALFVWLVCFATLVRGALTFYHVPHLALGRVEGRRKILGEVRGDIDPIAEAGGQSLRAFRQREQSVSSQVNPGRPKGSPQNVEQNENAGDDQQKDQ